MGKITMKRGGVPVREYDTKSKTSKSLPTAKYAKRNKAVAVPVVVERPIRKKAATSSNSVFPLQKFCTFEYSNSASLTSNTVQNTFGAGSVSYYLNAIWTPKTSSGLYNVQGYDQIKDIYNRYKVYGCKVRIVFTNPTQDGLYVGLRVHESGGTDFLGGEAISTAGMKKWTVIKPINKSGQASVSYERYWDIGKMHGITKNQMNSDISLYNADMGNYPTRKPYIELSLCNAQDTTAASISFKIECTYYTQLTGKKVLANSINA